MASAPKRRKCVDFSDEERVLMGEQACKTLLTEQRLACAELAEKLLEQAKMEYQVAKVNDGYTQGSPMINVNDGYENGECHYKYAYFPIRPSDDGLIRPTDGAMKTQKKESQEIANYALCTIS
ncbi:Hypothetical predicted protein [Paramuricea clavata]|uniref:Uncharacterized protein n=1 Tax=Paramuricea clavata TaxID=317549 RepID=A0A6S7FLV0_PARCT|nr:Hypothetical predicted protein [Paramuricea clavata]